ncbi:hypothetical protein [Nostoc sp.]
MYTTNLVTAGLSSALGELLTKYITSRAIAITHALDLADEARLLLRFL